jgi:hypothetical protein
MKSNPSEVGAGAEGLEAAAVVADCTIVVAKMDFFA